MSQNKPDSRSGPEGPDLCVCEFRGSQTGDWCGSTVEAEIPHQLGEDPYPPEVVFEAFARPELLAQWWGPNGFTNTFEVFEFRVGGRWKFVMHGPDGAHFPNESAFVELNAPSRVVIQHVSKPHYVLTITMTAHEAGTAITWNQEFEDPSVAARIRHIVEPANEQNLDRLIAVLAAQPAPFGI